MTGQDNPKETRLWELKTIIPVIWVLMIRYPTREYTQTAYHQLVNERHHILEDLKAG